MAVSTRLAGGCFCAMPWQLQIENFCHTFCTNHSFPNYYYCIVLIQDLACCVHFLMFSIVHTKKRVSVGISDCLIEILKIVHLWAQCRSLCESIVCRKGKHSKRWCNVSSPLSSKYSNLLCHVHRSLFEVFLVTKTTSKETWMQFMRFHLRT